MHVVTSKKDMQNYNKSIGFINEPFKKMSPVSTTRAADMSQVLYYALTSHLKNDISYP